MTQIMEVDPALFRRCFNRSAFMIDHCLSGHELFDLRELAELARRLPSEQVEYNAGDVPVNLHPALTPGNGLSAEETVERIEECNSWMVLKNVESVPEYRAVMQDCLHDLGRLASMILSGLHQAEAFIFVSSPGSITPFHIDPEHNFLLQLAGRKTVYVFDPADRNIMTNLDLERFFAGAHRNLQFDERWQRYATDCHLAPGTGAHIPVAAPHWVQNGDAVSVSFSVTFRSMLSKRLADVHQMNHRLRRMGFQPKPAGVSLCRDLLKQGANRTIRRSRTLLARRS